MTVAPGAAVFLDRDGVLICEAVGSEVPCRRSTCVR